MNLGSTATGGIATIDIDRLIDTRLLVNANSGAGKSHTLRRILEQTFGQVQHLVLDPEKEFLTLREKFDYIVAGPGGETPAHPASAALLCRRLLELGASAILDIYDLPMQQRKRFVRLFLESLINSPRELWHPTLVIVDEAHIFAPEKGHGESEATDAVNDLMSRGGKRGFCGVLATQRLSKLNKDAAAEANNVLIGRTTLDVDRGRALKILGMKQGSAHAIQTLGQGKWFAFGPAISQMVVEVHVGPVETRPPRRGELATAPPPPRDHVKAVLAKLADLPKEAEQEAQNLATAQRQIRELRQQLLAAPILHPPVDMVPGEEFRQAERQIRTLFVSRAEVVRSFAATCKSMSDRISSVSESILNYKRQIESELTGMLDHLPAPEPASKANELPVTSSHFSTSNEGAKRVVDPAPVSGRQPFRPPTPIPRAPLLGGTSMPKAERALLSVMRSRHPERTSLIQLSVLSGYSIKSSTFDKALGGLRGTGLCSGSGDENEITEAGIAAIGDDYQPPLEGQALLNLWMGKLERVEAAMLKVLVANPRGLTAEELSEITGYSGKSSTFDKGIGKLRSLDLACQGWPLRPASVLLSS